MVGRERDLGESEWGGRERDLGESEWGDRERDLGESERDAPEDEDGPRKRARRGHRTTDRTGQGRAPEEHKHSRVYVSLTPAQAGVYDVLRALAGVEIHSAQQEAASRLGVARPAVAQYLRLLAKKGLVKPGKGWGCYQITGVASMAQTSLPGRLGRASWEELDLAFRRSVPWSGKPPEVSGRVVVPTGEPQEQPHTTANNSAGKSAESLAADPRIGGGLRSNSLIIDQEIIDQEIDDPPTTNRKEKNYSPRPIFLRRAVLVELVWPSVKTFVVVEAGGGMAGSRNRIKFLAERMQEAIRKVRGLRDGPVYFYAYEGDLRKLVRELSDRSIGPDFYKDYVEFVEEKAFEWSEARYVPFHMICSSKMVERYLATFSGQRQMDFKATMEVLRRAGFNPKKIDINIVWDIVEEDTQEDEVAPGQVSRETWAAARWLQQHPYGIRYRPYGYEK